MVYKEIVSQIKEISNKRKELAEKLKDSISIFPILPIDLKGMKIVGVDGGFLAKRKHGVSFIIRRAVGVCFEYSDKLKTEYFPSKNPFPEVIPISDILEEHDFNTYGSLLRVERELSVALDSAKKFKPDVLILDGSVVLYPSNRPSASSSFFSKYLEVIALFKELYSFCLDNSILLIGSVEDSRSMKICKRAIKDEKLLSKFSDTIVLSYILKKNFRTEIMDYSESNSLPIIQDIEEFSKKLFSFYIRASDFDLPLRIDYLSNNSEEDAKKIASIMFAISSSFKEYSYPSVLIEADARAKLSERDLIFIDKIISSETGFLPDMLDLRRNKRAV